MDDDPLLEFVEKHVENAVRRHKGIGMNRPKKKRSLPSEPVEEGPEDDKGEGGLRYVHREALFRVAV